MNNTLKKALQKTASQVEKTTEMLVNKTRDWQTIKAYLSNRFSNLQLTAGQQEKLKRYEYLYNQLSSGKYSEQDVLNQMVNFFNVSLVQAYDDLHCTQEIFSTVININKRFELKLELSSARQLKRKCEEIGDFKAAAAFQKNIIALLKEIEDADQENPAELFEGHIIEAVFNPSLLKNNAEKVDMKEVLKLLNAKRNKKINIDLFEDISFEEVNHEK